MEDEFMDGGSNYVEEDDFDETKMLGGTMNGIFLSHKKLDALSPAHKAQLLKVMTFDNPTNGNPISIFKLVIEETKKESFLMKMFSYLLFPLLYPWLAYIDISFNIWADKNLEYLI